MDDREIIELFWQRDQRAVAEASDKYGGYCRAIAGRILPSPEDAEECVNDALYRAPSGVEEELDVRLLADCVERFVRTLPDTQRRVFLRRYWYLCSVKEVAAQSGMSVSRTSSMLFRLRKSLKQYLEKEGIMVYERTE